MCKAASGGYCGPQQDPWIDVAEKNLSQEHLCMYGVCSPTPVDITMFMLNYSAHWQVSSTYYALDIVISL